MAEKLFGRGVELNVGMINKAADDEDLARIVLLSESDREDVDVETVADIVADKREYYNLSIEDMYIVLEQIRSRVINAKSLGQDL